MRPIQMRSTIFLSLVMILSSTLVQASQDVDLRQLKLGLLQKLRSSMWEKIIVKEADLQKLNKTIPEKEEEIVLTKALQAELKANLTRASTCRQIGVVEDAPEEGTLECVVPGKHVLWNGLGKVLLGTSLESSFSFLTLSYMPFDATLIASTMVTFIGFAYGALMYKIVTSQ